MTDALSFPRKSPRILTPEDIATIIVSPLPSRAIAKEYGVHRSRILDLRGGDRPCPQPLDPAARREAKRLRDRERQRAKYRERRLRDYVRPEGTPRIHISAAPPPHVLEEAMRAMAAPRELTAILCGDPPLGRSALDRMTGAE
jgi:hypothetical protein